MPRLEQAMDGRMTGRMYPKKGCAKPEELPGDAQSPAEFLPPMFSRPGNGARSGFKLNRFPDGEPVRVDEDSLDVMVFQDNLESPYTRSLHEAYDMPPRERFKGCEVSGMCPVCNNSMRRHWHRKVIGGLSPWALAKASGASGEEVAVHLARHFAPIFVWAGREAGVLPDLSDGALSRMDSKSPMAAIRRGLSMDLEAEPGFRSTGDAQAVAPSVDEDYAMDGRVAHGPLKVWTRGRARRELLKVAHEAINFYDEMMDIRAKVRDIYDKVMDENDPKFYPTALSATREMRGVVETLGKMSLIAKRLSEDSAGERKVSPELESVMRSLGIQSGDLAITAGQAEEMLGEALGDEADSMEPEVLT